MTFKKPGDTAGIALKRSSRGNHEDPWYLDSTFALNKRTFSELLSAV